MSNAEISRYVVEGVLTTTSPLHITQAGTTGHLVNRRDGTLGARLGKKEGTFPVTLTRSTVFFPETSAGYEESEEEDVQYASMKQEIPIIPASTLRGMLRRGAARIIEDHVIETLNTKLTYDAYQGLHCGAISGSPDGIPPTTEEIRSARRHVFYGVFGGGPRMLPGNLRASDGIPVIDRVVRAGLLPDTLLDHALKGVRPQQLYTVNPVVRKDDFYGVHSDGGAANLVDNYDEVYAAERDKALQSAIKSKDENEPTGERGVRAMSFRQDVAMGVPFRIRLEVNGTQAQVGLLLAALDRALPQGVGGRSALGFGRLAGTIHVKDAAGNRVIAAGVQDGIVEMQEGAEPYLDAMTREVSELSLEDITRYMSSALSKEEKKKKVERKGKK